jgi:hypothetical protein
MKTMKIASRCVYFQEKNDVSANLVGSIGWSDISVSTDVSQDARMPEWAQKKIKNRHFRLAFEGLNEYTNNHRGKMGR